MSERTLSRVFQAIGIYCKDHRDLEHTCQADEDSIRYQGRVFATYKWPEDKRDNRPIIEFLYITDPTPEYNEHDIWERNQFIRRPFFDNRMVLHSIDQIVYEIIKRITLRQAYDLRWLRIKQRDKLDIDMKQFDKIRLLIEKTVKDVNSYIQSDVAPWQHLAMCAIYDL